MKAAAGAQSGQGLSITRAQVELADIVLVHQLVAVGDVVETYQMTQLVHDDRANEA